MLVLTRLVVDTTDVETLVALPESCVRVSFYSSYSMQIIRQRTISLDGDGCNISTLLDGSGRARDRCGKDASDGSNGGGLHGDSGCV